jgi:hypothetical protein
MGQCIPINDGHGTWGFMCIRGGPPVRKRVTCDECGRDCAERSDGTVWKHEPLDPATGLQRRNQTCSGAFKAPKPEPVQEELPL